MDVKKNFVYLFFNSRFYVAKGYPYKSVLSLTFVGKHEKKEYLHSLFNRR